MTAMDIRGWSRRSRRDSRPGCRPVAAWVERLEQRRLLTLQVNPISPVAGQYFSTQVATFAAGDVQGALSDFQATIYWTGANNLISGGFIAPNGPGTYVVYGTNLYPQPGSYPVNVVVTGANNSSAQAFGTATVADAPLSVTPATTTPLIQTPFSGAVGSFQTTNPYAVAANFQATIDWGDGTPPTAGNISSNGFQSFQVLGQHTYAAVGTFPVTVAIRSPGGTTSVINSTAAAAANPVSVLPVAVTGNAGQPLRGVTVATVLDPYTTDTAASFRATVDWGDGTVTVGAIAAQGDGVFAVTGDHTYATPGTYGITVQVVRAANGQAASGTSSATITAQPVSVLPVAVTGSAGQPLNGVRVATVLDPSITDTPASFVATVAWGDGIISAGTLSPQGAGLYAVTGDHTYAAPGTYSITVRVVRIASGQAASGQSTAQVGSPSPTQAFSGGLASVPSNGAYTLSGYATTSRPTFSGTSAPFAIVQLFAQPSGVDGQVPLGETVADASGHWSLATNPIAPGTYLVSAVVTPPAGYPGLMTPLTANSGVFHLDLLPNGRAADAPSGGGSGHGGRSKARHVAEHRAPRAHRVRPARSTPDGGSRRG